MICEYLNSRHIKRLPSFLKNHFNDENVNVVKMVKQVLIYLLFAYLKISTGSCRLVVDSTLTGKQLHTSE